MVIPIAPAFKKRDRFPCDKREGRERKVPTLAAHVSYLYKIGLQNDTTVR
jgi:hypothetical protein